MTEDDLQRIIEEIDCPPHQFEFGPLMGSGHWWVRVKKLHADGWSMKDRTGPMHVITPGMSMDMIVYTCLQAVRDFADYEVRGAFLWRGKPVFAAPLDAIWKAL